MKQLTFVLILCIPFTLINCSDKNIASNKIQEQTPQSRSIANIDDANCIDSEIISSQKMKSNLPSTKHNYESNKNGFQLPSLSNKDLIQSDHENHTGVHQSIFDDVDPEKI